MRDTPQGMAMLREGLRCIIFRATNSSSSLSRLSSVPDDLTPQEKQELEDIRRRKQELMEDIQVILRGLDLCVVI